VLLVALTGGIGAGKSTVASMLEQLGAVVIDADDLARRAVDPGTPGLARVLDAFGPAVAAADGSLDRERMARIAFDDPGARGRLEAIVHPEVARLFAEEVQRQRATANVVVYAVPLLVESGLSDAFDVVVTVAADPQARASRVAAQGRLSEADARRRMAAQASDEERAAVADVVLDNDGSVDELRETVDRLWQDLRRRSAGAE